MLVLSNSVPQTISAGENVLFDTVVLETGRNSSHRKNSGVVVLRERGMYEIFFRANVGGDAATIPTIAISLDGDALQETVMETTITAITDEYGVAAFTVVKNFCGCDKVTVTNVGTADAEVLNPCIVVKHIS